MNNFFFTTPKITTLVMDNGRKFSSRSTTIEAFDVFKKKNVRLKVYSIEKTDRIGTPAT